MDRKAPDMALLSAMWSLGRYAASAPQANIPGDRRHPLTTGDQTNGLFLEFQRVARPCWGSKPPGRPEIHLQPPTEPCVNLSIYTARPPCPCHLAMTVDAESDSSSRLLGWRPPSLMGIRFAPRSLQALRRYYRMIRPPHAHRYFPPSCFAPSPLLIRFSLRMASTSSQVPYPSPD